MIREIREIRGVNKIEHRGANKVGSSDKSGGLSI